MIFVVFFSVIVMVIAMMRVMSMVKESLELTHQCLNLDRQRLVQQRLRHERGNSLKSLVVAQQVAASEDVGRGMFAGHV